MFCNVLKNYELTAARIEKLYCEIIARHEPIYIDEINRIEIAGYRGKMLFHLLRRLHEHNLIVCLHWKGGSTIWDIAFCPPELWREWEEEDPSVRQYLLQGQIRDLILE